MFGPDSVGADPGRMDAMARQLLPELRAQAMVAGVVLLGEEAPDAWRIEARTLALAAERPYLRPPR